MHPGQGPGLSLHDLGEEDGSETITLLQSETPSHSHALSGSTQPGEDAAPAGEVLARSVGASLYHSTINQNVVSMGAAALAPTGGGQPHNNMQPFLTLNFCIALQGVFPPRG
jgi:microcystin-dependent protein